LESKFAKFPSFLVIISSILLWTELLRFKLATVSSCSKKGKMSIAFAYVISRHSEIVACIAIMPTASLLNKYFESISTCIFFDSPIAIRLNHHLKEDRIVHY